MNRLTGFFGGGKKSNDDGGMGPEKTDPVSYTHLTLPTKA